MASTDAIERVSRMRKLSAMLDDEEDMGDDNGEGPLSQLHAKESMNDKELEPYERSTSGQVMCVECRAHAAELFCEQCHDYFCDLCFGGQHRKGNRRRHTHQPVGTPDKTKDVDMPISLDARGDDKDDNDDSGARSAPSYSMSSTTDTPMNDQDAQDMVERAKYIPVRLTYEERRLLHILEAALSVSSYTDKLDTPAYMAPAKRVRAQLQDICGFLSGIMTAADYRSGQEVLEDKDFAQHEEFLQEIFELGRRYKIMNPEKMRGEYGKLMYLLQDANSPHIQDLLGFSCLRKIRSVYDVLQEAGAEDALKDPKIGYATMVVTPEGKSRMQIQRQIKMKEKAIKEITSRYTNHKLTKDDMQQCLYSIADNNYHLYFERDPIDRMIALLKEHFDPTQEKEGASLAIVSGNDGARLSHSHTRQFNYVLQSLTLWREIAHDMFRLWCLTDEDLLADGTSYNLTDTGQGLHRIQQSPRVSRAMHVILHSTQRRLDSWVGSSVIHLGDKNVPNALIFIDKYTQVGHILRPIVKTVDAIDDLCSKSKELNDYIVKTFNGPAALKRTILSDFFREAFDGSGADNFFDAGSCIDGRLTSAWNWCSNLDKKPFFPIFKLSGFVGFDGKFG